MADPVNTPASGDVRPVVRTSSGIDFAPWIFGAVVLAAGLWVFFGLSASRLDDRAPATAVPQDYGSGRIASPDGIDMPDRFNLEPRSPERLAEQARPVELRALPQAPQPYFEPPSAPPRIVDYPTPPAPPPQPYVATFGGAPAAQADSSNSDASAAAPRPTRPAVPKNWRRVCIRQASIVGSMIYPLVKNSLRFKSMRANCV